MLAIAVQQGADLDRIQKLMDLKDRWDAAQARKAYVAAMARFKAEQITIQKTKRADIPGGAKYSYAPLFEVCNGVIPALSKHGFSHDWEVSQSENWISVTCILTHEFGHSERRTLGAPPDTSGKKNPIQEIASTVSYLERYTLLAVTGLSASDMDNDGVGGKDKQQANQPTAPTGYNDWRADMSAVADEGKERLQAVWAKTADEYRRFAIKHDESWWNDMKAKATKVSKKMPA